MDANAQYELYLIKNELQSIIDELYSIAGGISRDFEGIGNSQCSNSILKAVSQYETAKHKLDTMNLSVVTEEFAAKQRAEAEAKAEEKVQAKAEEKVPAKAQSSKSNSNNSSSKNSNNLLEDLFGWLLK